MTDQPGIEMAERHARDSITVEELLSERQEYLELTLSAGEAGLKRVIRNPHVNRPGLALTGFFTRFAGDRVQLLGATEMAYIEERTPEDRRRTLARLFERELPCVVVSKGIAPPTEMVEMAGRTNTPLLSTKLGTGEFYFRLSSYLDSLFVPWTMIHGTLVDVYGVGLLYTGKAGIGKSECALDLVERGHRLVADDMVRVTKKAPDVIMGSGSQLLGTHMEIRGVGIVDVEKLFGIRSVRVQKRIEVEVRLELWRDDHQYERLGLEDTTTRLLGVEIPLVTLPVSPGKNITVLSEVISMNHMLKVYGHSVALEFTKRLSEELHRKKRTTGYLESDYE